MLYGLIMRVKQNGKIKKYCALDQYGHSVQMTYSEVLKQTKKGNFVNLAPAGDSFNGKNISIQDIPLFDEKLNQIKGIPYDMYFNQLTYQIQQELMKQQAKEQSKIAEIANSNMAKEASKKMHKEEYLKHLESVERYMEFTDRIGEATVRAKITTNNKIKNTNITQYNRQLDATTSDPKVNQFIINYGVMQVRARMIAFYNQAKQVINSELTEKDREFYKPRLNQAKFFIERILELHKETRDILQENAGIKKEEQQQVKQEQQDLKDEQKRMEELNKQINEETKQKFKEYKEIIDKLVTEAKSIELTLENADQSFATLSEIDDELTVVVTRIQEENNQHLAELIDSPLSNAMMYVAEKQESLDDKFKRLQQKQVEEEAIEAQKQAKEAEAKQKEEEQKQLEEQKKAEEEARKLIKEQEEAEQKRLEEEKEKLRQVREECESRLEKAKVDIDRANTIEELELIQSENTDYLMGVALEYEALKDKIVEYSREIIEKSDVKITKLDRERREAEEEQAYKENIDKLNNIVEQFMNSLETEQYVKSIKNNRDAVLDSLKYPEICENRLRQEISKLQDKVKRESYNKISKLEDVELDKLKVLYKKMCTWFDEIEPIDKRIDGIECNRILDELDSELKLILVHPNILECSILNSKLADIDKVHNKIKNRIEKEERYNDTLRSRESFVIDFIAKQKVVDTESELTDKIESISKHLSIYDNNIHRYIDVSNYESVKNAIEEYKIKCKEAIWIRGYNEDKAIRDMLYKISRTEAVIGKSNYEKTIDTLFNGVSYKVRYDSSIKNELSRYRQKCIEATRKSEESKKQDIFIENLIKSKLNILVDSTNIQIVHDENNLAYIANAIQNNINSASEQFNNHWFADESKESSCRNLIVNYTKNVENKLNNKLNLIKKNTYKKDIELNDLIYEYEKNIYSKYRSSIMNFVFKNILKSIYAYIYDASHYIDDDTRDYELDMSYGALEELRSNYSNAVGFLLNNLSQNYKDNIEDSIEKAFRKILNDEYINGVSYLNDMQAGSSARNTWLNELENLFRETLNGIEQYKIDYDSNSKITLFTDIPDVDLKGISGLYQF